MKDKTEKEHQHDIVYHVNCPEESCENSYIGKSGRSVVEKVKDHKGRDNKFNFLKYSMEKRHAGVELNYFKIIGRNFKNKCERKVFKALLIK